MVIVCCVWVTQLSFFVQAEDGIRDSSVTGVQTCALPILNTCPLNRTHAEQAIQQFNGQVFNGRPLAVSEARAREDRGPGGPPRPGGYSGPRPGGGFTPRPSGSFGGPRPFDPGGSSAPGGAPGRSRNFGPDAKPQRGSAKGKRKKSEDKPGGPIPSKQPGRS